MIGVNGQEEDRRRSREAGFDEHLLKPIALDAVKGLFRHPKLVHGQGAWSAGSLPMPENRQCF